MHVQPDGFERRRLDVVTALVGLAVFAACAVLAHGGTVGQVERRAFEAINGLPDALSPAMRQAQLLGILAVGPIVVVVALVLRRPRLAIAAALVTVGKLAAERIVWQIVQRDRPGTTIADAIVRGTRQRPASRSSPATSCSSRGWPGW